MSDKPLPDEMLGKLLKLPERPYRPLTGHNFAHMKYPPMKRLWLTRIWCAIPSAHKDEGQKVISPEAFNIVGNYLVQDL